MDNSRPGASPSHDEFLAAILGKHDPADSAAFAAAILYEYGPGQPREKRVRSAADIYHEAFLDAILHGRRKPSTGFVDGIVREYNFNADEPRDERGRWTDGGSGTSGSSSRSRRAHDDWLRALANCAPAPSGTSGDPVDDDARNELKKAGEKGKERVNKGLDELFKGADEAKKGPDVAKWKSSQTGNTTKNANILRKNLEKAGTKFNPGEQAHHIVQSTDPRAATARELLDKYQIDINSAENGLKLTRQVHQTTGLQQTKAINAVTSRLQKVAQGVKEADVRQSLLGELSKLNQAIASGKLPCP